MSNNEDRCNQDNQIQPHEPDAKEHLATTSEFENNFSKNTGRDENFQSNRDFVILELFGKQHQKDNRTDDGLEDTEGSITFQVQDSASQDSHFFIKSEFTRLLGMFFEIKMIPH
mmetsp:Transcript_20782/g.23502  ORF Transcript_20782/g.23502 Transcript_20782/m.23502 type:complete len:114 (+) Transcript_20782:699-1040(+)